MNHKPLNVLWLIDHVCYDGSLHGGGRLFRSLPPRFDGSRIRIFPYFLRASNEVREVFKDAPVPVVTLDKGKYDPTTLLAVDELCRRHDIDVMHLYCYGASSFGRLVGTMRRIPSVIHDFDTQVYFPYPLYLNVLDRVLARSTGRAMAASSFCRHYMHEVRRLPLDDVEVMFHAIPPRHLELSQTLTRAAARRALGWADDDFVFCAITKLGPERGNEALVTAFAQLRAGNPRARLVVVYKPTLYHKVPKEYEGIDWIRDPAAMRARMQQLVNDAGVADSVDLVESLDSPENYYAGSDVIVAPFENVRFSSVNLVEAMAYGRPHIVTAIGEPHEIAAAWGTGLVVPPADPAALAQAMQRVIAEPALLAELGHRAREAARHFTTEAAVERLSHIYESLAAGRKPAPVGIGDRP